MYDGILGTVTSSVDTCPGTASEKVIALAKSTFCCVETKNLKQPMPGRQMLWTV